MQINDRKSSLTEDLLNREFPVELAELEVKAQAAETEVIASATFTSRAESMGRDVALADYNRRVSRLARSCDPNIRDVVYTHASAASGETGQHWHSWASITRKHNKLHPNRPLSAHRFRMLSYKLRGGVLDIKTRRQGKFDRKPNAQQSNMVTVHVGLSVTHGALVLHDFNAPLADAEIPAVRPTCLTCGGAFDAKRSDAAYCSAKCRKAASRKTDVTDNAQRDEHRDAHRDAHHNSLELQRNVSRSSSPRCGDLDDELHEGFSEELPSCPSAQAGEDLPGPASTQPREDRGDDGDDGDVWSDIFPCCHGTATLQRPALAKRAQAHGLDMDEVERMLVNFICGRLDGFDPSKLGPGGVMTYLVKMTQAHRKWEANREENEAAEAARNAQLRESVATQSRWDAEREAKAAAAEEKRAKREAMEARLKEATRLEEDHRQQHPDHYGPCGECSGCAGARGDGRCYKPVRQADCGHDPGEDIEISHDWVKLAGYGSQSIHNQPKVYLHGPA